MSSRVKDAYVKYSEKVSFSFPASNGKVQVSVIDIPIYELKKKFMTLEKISFSNLKNIHQIGVVIDESVFNYYHSCWENYDVFPEINLPLIKDQYTTFMIQLFFKEETLIKDDEYSVDITFNPYIMTTCKQQSLSTVQLSSLKSVPIDDEYSKLNIPLHFNFEITEMNIKYIGVPDIESISLCLNDHENDNAYVIEKISSFHWKIVFKVLVNFSMLENPILILKTKASSTFLSEDKLFIEATNLNYTFSSRDDQKLVLMG